LTTFCLVAGNSACKVALKLMSNSIPPKPLHESIQVFHSSKYGESSTLTLGCMVYRVLEFMGDCKDITFSDRLSCAIDLKELEHLIVQIFDNQHEDEREMSLYIELNRGVRFPSFATVYVQEPAVVDVNQIKLDAIKANTVKMREGLAKCKSSDVEDGLKEIETIIGG